jgi:glycosyltransferase involved in cell wall biosynthesis
LRIAIVNWTPRKVGGVESYLSQVIPGLTQAGHKVAFWYEVDEPQDRSLIPLPPDVPAWNAAALGTDAALAALRDWTADVIYAHGMRDPALERRVQSIAPAIFFAHNYYGTCIAGEKAHKFPTIEPCHRRFGPACLLHYFPRRCGGLSPITMMRLYWQQRARLRLLPGYRAIVTHSEHMEREYLNHGLQGVRIVSMPYLYNGAEPRTALPLVDAVDDSGASPALSRRLPGNGRHCVFLGRMVRLKGGDVFLKALGQAAALLGIPLQATFAGDGPARDAWEQVARRVQAEHSQVRVAFPGWLNEQGKNDLLQSCDLLVVPSLWPEPFGLVGVEAGWFGIPAAGFDVGGISSWLVEGENGHLAPGDPPSAAGLAQAISRCFQDPVHYRQLRQGARRLAERFTLEKHTSALLAVFQDVVRAGGVNRSG